MHEPLFTMPSIKQNKIEAFQVDNLKINEERHLSLKVIFFKF